MVARLLWEREAQVRAVALGKPGKPWDSWADSTLHLAGNWSKIGVDHMFDHNWKISYPGVAQLVARLLWEQDAGSSSLPTRTKTLQNLLILQSFSLFLLQNDQNAFKHFPAEKLAYSKAVKACLMTGFPPYFLPHALRLKQSMSRITFFESSEFKEGYLCI